MGNFNFRRDLANAKNTEEFVAGRLKDTRGYRVIHRGEDNKYDYLFKTPGGAEVKIEIKEDLSCPKFHNVALEFECRGKPSGIETTEADFYIYVVHTPEKEIVYVLHTVEKLKELVEKPEWHRIGTGGDNGSNTKVYLFEYKKFINSGTILDLALDK